MSAKAVDVLILVPLIPAIPVIATWWLPWESWVPKKVPKKFLGPYLLYAAFAGWHFQMSWWFEVWVVLAGIVVSAMAVLDVRKARQLKQARYWPVTEARVLGVGQSRDENGTVKVTLTYTYKVHDERYGGRESFAFAKEKEEDAARFENACRERTFNVHYRPDKPEISVLLREDSVIVEKSPLR